MAMSVSTTMDDDEAPLSSARPLAKPAFAAERQEGREEEEEDEEAASLPLPPAKEVIFAASPRCLSKPELKTGTLQLSVPELSPTFAIYIMWSTRATILQDDPP